MQKLKVFLVLTGYQLTWLACVFGETKFSNPMLGIWVGIIFLLTYFYLNHNKQKFIKISLLISVPGYFFDTLLKSKEEIITLQGDVMDFVKKFDLNFYDIHTLDKKKAKEKIKRY